MDRTSDVAIEILNELRANFLIYSNEYVPLIDCANQCKDYEDTGLTPEDLKSALDTNSIIKLCAQALGVSS